MANEITPFTECLAREDANLARMLGEKKYSFVNNVVAVVSQNKQLQRCDPQGVIYAAVKATALDLPLDGNLGYAYVVPYGATAQFQIGWRGLVQLAQRSGNLAAINVRDVRHGEIVGEEFVSGELQFKGLPAAQRVQTPICGYVAYFRLTNGFAKTLYMSIEELNIHGQRFSKTYANPQGVWATNFDAMAKKTVLKLLLSRWCPLSVELRQAVAADQGVISSNGEIIYADSPTEGRTAPPAAPSTGDRIAKEIMAPTQRSESATIEGLR